MKKGKLKRNYALDKVAIHKGAVDFGMGYVLCGRLIIEGNMAYHWRNVTCKNCLKLKKTALTKKKSFLEESQ